MAKINIYRKSIDRRIILISGYVIVIGMIIGGCIGLVHADRLSKKYNSTTAKIEEIRVEPIYSKQSERITNAYHVIVSYEVEGITYQTSLGHYRSSWKTGDLIPIGYNPQDPAKIATINGNKLISKLFIGIGLVTLALLWGFTKLINKIYGGNFWKHASY